MADIGRWKNAKDAHAREFKCSCRSALLSGEKDDVLHVEAHVADTASEKGKWTVRARRIREIDWAKTAASVRTTSIQYDRTKNNWMGIRHIDVDRMRKVEGNFCCLDGCRQGDTLITYRETTCAN